MLKAKNSVIKDWEKEKVGKQFTYFINPKEFGEYTGVKI